MRATGIIEMVIAVGIALLVATLTYGAIDNYLPDEPRQASCRIVDQEVVCGQKSSRPE